MSEKWVQSARRVLMMRPSSFGFNPETASSNAFQKPATGDVQALAIAEFDAAVATLESHGIEVIVVEEAPRPPKPDSVFPNNWFACSPTGIVALFPMAAENRRLERRPGLFEGVGTRLLDLTHHELEGRFLEGTGSLVIDWINTVAYRCRSPRSDESVATEFCDASGLELVAFDAVDSGGTPIYHTNVMMAIGTGWAIVCREALSKGEPLDRLAATGRKIVEISMQQMQEFAGNALELRNEAGEKFIIMSERAKRALEPDQVAVLQEFGTIVAIAIPTIESVGGGSARCMIGEIFFEPDGPKVGGPGVV